MESVTVKTFAEYQAAAMRTCTESSRNKEYMILEILSEIGEAQGKIAKVIRDDAGVVTEEKRTEIIKELGDVMWGIVGFCAVCDTHFAVEEHENIAAFDDDAADILGDLKERRDENGTFEVAVLLGFRAGELCNSIAHNMPKADSLINITMEVACMARYVDSSLLEVCQTNIDKLADRFNRNMIGGSGDNR